MVTLPVERERLQRVVACVNNKGGVGKTTMTTNLAGFLAVGGWRVLVVDLDPQGNVALDLGYSSSEENDHGRALAMAIQYPEHAPVPVRVRENLDVLVGGPELSAVERIMSGVSGDRANRLALAQVLTAVQAVGDYDLILVDCPPGSDALQKLALAAARWMLVPVRTDQASLEGLKLTATRSDTVLDVNPDLNLLGVSIFATNPQATVLKREFVQSILDVLLPTDLTDEQRAEAADRLVFDATIRTAESPANASRRMGKLFHEVEVEAKRGPKWYEQLKSGGAKRPAAPASAASVAEDFERFADEFATRLIEREVAANV